VGKRKKLPKKALSSDRSPPHKGGHPGMARFVESKKKTQTKGDLKSCQTIGSAIKPVLTKSPPDPPTPNVFQGLVTRSMDNRNLDVESRNKRTQLLRITEKGM